MMHFCTTLSPFTFSKILIDLSSPTLASQPPLSAFRNVVSQTAPTTVNARLSFVSFSLVGVSHDTLFLLVFVLSTACSHCSFVELALCLLLSFQCLLFFSRPKWWLRGEIEEGPYFFLFKLQELDTVGKQLHILLGLLPSLSGTY